MQQQQQQQQQHVQHLWGHHQAATRTAPLRLFADGDGRTRQHDADQRRETQELARAIEGAAKLRARITHTLQLEVHGQALTQRCAE